MAFILRRLLWLFVFCVCWRSWAELFFVLAFLPAKVLYLGSRSGAELLFSVPFLPPDFAPLEEGESGELRPGLFPFRQCFASFCFQDIPFLFSEGETHVHFKFTLDLQLLEESTV